MKIAILTDFKTRNSAYSLTHVVDNQVQMLSRYGHEPVVFAREDFADPEPYPDMRRVVPVFNPADYASQAALTEDHKTVAARLAEILPEELSGFDVVFTHDWILSPFKLPLATGLVRCAEKTRHIPHYHWLHSRPSGNVKTNEYYDWYNLRAYGSNHKLVYLNNADQILVADAFRIDQRDVRIIPNVKDLRVISKWSADAWAFADEYPAMMEAGFVQIYPAEVGRLTDKGVRHLIHLFAAIKWGDNMVEERMRHNRPRWPVCLVIADGWSGYREREDINRYKAMAQRVGLVPGYDFILTSDFPGYENGVPYETLMDLMCCCNLFVFPSSIECDPLIPAEAVIRGGALLVLNRSLPVMQEIGRNTALYFDFGSADKPYDCSGDYHWMANKIINTFLGLNHARTLVRRSLNMDSIFTRFYEPILSEASADPRLAAASKMAGD